MYLEHVIMGKVNKRTLIRRVMLIGLLAISMTACMSVQTPVVPTMTPAPTPTPTSTVSSSQPNPESTPALASSSAALDAEGFADSAFRSLWQRYDGEVATGTVKRGWFWGQPVPFGAMQEPYAESPGGKRLVQYFDKGRMEINDPTADPTGEWYVTSGLLTLELVTGRMQVGSDSFDNRNPAQIPVTGDLDNPDPETPLYADYSGDRLSPVPDRTGQPVITQFMHNQPDIQITPQSPVHIASYDAALGHNIPDVFVNYFDRDLSAMGLNWLYVMGHPISEPYWVNARFGGKSELVLVQLFERRALSFNPSNDSGLQIEFTNIGLHYYRWRYHDRTGLNSSAAPIAAVDRPRAELPFTAQ